MDSEVSSEVDSIVDNEKGSKVGRKMSRKMSGKVNRKIKLKNLTLSVSANQSTVFSVKAPTTANLGTLILSLLVVVASFGWS